MASWPPTGARTCICASGAVCRTHCVERHSIGEVEDGSERSGPPLAQTLEVLERVDRGWLNSHSFAGETPARAAPFDALSLELGKLWMGASRD